MTEGKRIILFTGDGKGKTTAALGMVMRAGGHGMKVLVIQFVKSDASTGELTACRQLPGIEVVQTGRGFVPRLIDPAYGEHVKAAEEGLALAARAISSGRYGLVVLDEVCLAVAMGLLEEGQVSGIVCGGSPDTCVVMTGRNASPGLISIADTVTEMRMVKHGYKEGIPAQKGVEY